MDNEIEKRLKDELGEVDGNALYVLIDSHSGFLLEDLAPLLSSLETVYRKLIVLGLDRSVRKSLQIRQEGGESVAGISRSINSRYEKIMLSSDSEYARTSDEKRRIEPIDYDLPPIRRSEKQEHLDNVSALNINEASNKYIPSRIELARTRVNSPGFIELLGDPSTLTALSAILAALVLIRGQNIQKIYAKRQNQNDTIKTLIQMGFNRKEINSVQAYLDSDLTQIIEELEKSKTRLVLGRDLEHSHNKSKD